MLPDHSESLPTHTMLTRYLQLAMGNILGSKQQEVTLVAVKRRSVDNGTASQRSMLRTSSSRTRLREFSPFPTDVGFVSMNESDVLVVADYRNKLLKTFSPWGNREMDIKGVPYRMTVTASESVAVTLPLSNEIILVSVRDMYIKKRIPTARMYNGITSIPKVSNTLAVGTLREEPGVVDLIDMKGDILKSFTSDLFGNIICMTPSFLSATPSGDILISDYSLHALICLTQSGDVRWRHHPSKGDHYLEDPVGVVCCDNDHIFLVDRLKRSVFRFTSDGWCFGPVIQIKDEFCEPFSICADRQKTIFIALDDGNIQVYPDGETSPIKTVLELPKRHRIT